MRHHAPQKRKFNIYRKLPSPKDSWFSVPIRTPINVLVGRQAPANFSLLWGRIIRFILGIEKLDIPNERLFCCFKIWVIFTFVEFEKVYAFLRPVLGSLSVFITGRVFEKDIMKKCFFSEKKTKKKYNLLTTFNFKVMF